MTPAPSISLESPASGTDLGPTPCRTRLDAAVPVSPVTGPTLGLTFSGGGFRATLAALGMLRFLSDAHLLGNVRYVSSVSGGSITNGLLALAWPQIRDAGHTTAVVEERLIEPTVARLSEHSLKRALILRAPRLIGPRNRTDLLGDLMDRWFFGGTEMEQLDPEVRWIINAANITTGVRFAFERDILGDYVSGRVKTACSGVRLAQAVAASAAVPGAFAPWTVKGLEFPCAQAAPKLLDGGVYDNTGLQALDRDRYSNVFTVTMNAGGLLRAGAYGRIPVIRDLSRANSLLYRQSTALRTHMMVSAFQRSAGLAMMSPLPDAARRGVLVNLGTTIADGSPQLEDWRVRFPEERTWEGHDLALYPTVFDRIPRELCRRLIYRGWWLIGAAFSDYYPDLLPALDTLPPPALT